MNIDQEIIKISQAQQTGTLMAVSKEKLLGRLYLVNGVVTTARYQNLQGEYALQSIKSMDVDSVKFHRGRDLVRSHELLTADGQIPPQRVDQAENPLATDAPQVVINQNDQVIPASNIEKIMMTDLLSEYVGPVAAFLVADLDKKLSAREMIRLLAREIDNTDQASVFFNVAISRL